MNDFQYLRPESVSEALRIKERFGAGARFLLGGTDLMVRVLKGRLEPEAVVDLKRVADLGASIGTDAGTVSVGARVVLSDLVRHEPIARLFPALAESASIVGSVQIRNRATLVGNVCNASPAADTVPALIAYGASVTIVGTGGSRRAPLESFFLGPGRTACGPTELVAAVHIPVPRPPSGSAFGRLTRRKGVDLATVNVACAIDCSGVTTFVFGAAGPTPIVARDDTGDLAGPDLPETRREELLAALVGRTRPISDVRSGREYRLAMLQTIGRRVLLQARQRHRAEAG
jgi:CO/xanthine dehydrogenase FAD-binding subunit